MKTRLLTAALTAISWSFVPALAADTNGCLSSRPGITGVNTPDLSVSGWHGRRPLTNPNQLNAMPSVLRCTL
jgi:hypothetical protein